MCEICPITVGAIAQATATPLQVWITYWQHLLVNRLPKLRGF